MDKLTKYLPSSMEVVLKLSKLVIRIVHSSSYCLSIELKVFSGDFIGINHIVQFSMFAEFNIVNI